MKFASSFTVAAALFWIVLAAPPPQADASATTSASGFTSISSKTSAPATTTHAGRVRRLDIQIPYSTSNALFSLTPADPGAWETIEAPGVFNLTASFSIRDQNEARARFAPPQEFAAIEVWAYQRSDGGVMTMTLDGVAFTRIDYFNRTASRDNVPVKVYENKALRRAHHVIEFINLEDPRVKKYGQFNIDHVVITAEADAPLSHAPSSTHYVTTVTRSATSPTVVPTTPTGQQPPQNDSASTTPPPDAALCRSTSTVLLTIAALVAASTALF